MRDEIGKKLQHMAELENQNIKIEEEISNMQESHKFE